MYSKQENYKKKDLIIKNIHKIICHVCHVNISIQEKIICTL